MGEIYGFTMKYKSIKRRSDGFMEETKNKPLDCYAGNIKLVTSDIYSEIRDYIEE